MTDITYSDYWTEIQSIVETTFEECREHQREPSEQLHETIDGHEWVIYTHSNHDVLKVSPNDGYAISEGLSTGLDDNGGIAFSQLAFGAMYADCMEHALPDGCDWNEIPEQAEAPTE